MFKILISTLVVSLIVTAADYASAQQREQSRSESPAARTIIASGRVRLIGSTQLFALDDPTGKAASRLVRVPRSDAIPPDGSTVVVGGVLRPLDQADPSLEGHGADFKSDTMVVARSVITQNGSDLLRGTRTAASVTRLMSDATLLSRSQPPAMIEARGGVVQAQPAATIEARAGVVQAQVRPSILANLIEEFAGKPVRVNGARVVGVLSPRVFLIEPATVFLMTMGYRDRIAVLIGGSGELRVDPETLVGSTITIAGVARTALGLAVSRDVAWPSEFTKDYMKRLEIRGAVLASSVQSPDGVELTVGGAR